MPALSYFALVPLTQEHLLQPNIEIAVCPIDSPYITFPSLQFKLEEKTRNDQILQKTNEALITFTNELKRLKKVLLHAVGQSDSNG